jgi:hypothetical protein
VFLGSDTPQHTQRAPRHRPPRALCLRSCQPKSGCIYPQRGLRRARPGNLDGCCSYSTHLRKDANVVFLGGEHARSVHSVIDTRGLHAPVPPRFSISAVSPHQLVRCCRATANYSRNWKRLEVPQMRTNFDFFYLFRCSPYKQFGCWKLSGLEWCGRTVFTPVQQLPRFGRLSNECDTPSDPSAHSVVLQRLCHTVRPRQPGLHGTRPPFYTAVATLHSSLKLVHAPEEGCEMFVIPGRARPRHAQRDLGTRPPRPCTSAILSPISLRHFSPSTLHSLLPVRR